jgi:hypothetical protein
MRLSTFCGLHRDTEHLSLSVFMSVSAKSSRFRQVHGSALLNWRCKDLQHLLLFAEDIEILGLTGDNTFLLNKFQDGVPLQLKNNTQHHNTKTIVRYQKDQCTKNIRMFQILTRGLFLTCTGNSFYSEQHKLSRCVLLFAKRSNLLEKAIPVSWRKFSIHSGPLLKVKCPFAPCVSFTPCTYSPHTDNLFLHRKMTLTSMILLSGTPIPII